MVDLLNPLGIPPIGQFGAGMPLGRGFPQLGPGLPGGGPNGPITKPAVAPAGNQPHPASPLSPVQHGLTTAFHTAATLNQGLGVAKKIGSVVAKAAPVAEEVAPDVAAAAAV